MASAPAIPLASKRPRFISQDPLGFSGSGPNLYAYVFESPTNLVDPFGLQSQVETSSGTVAQHYPGNPAQAAVDQTVADAEPQMAAQATRTAVAEIFSATAARAMPGMRVGS